MLARTPYSIDNLEDIRINSKIKIDTFNLDKIAAIISFNLRFLYTTNKSLAKE